MNFDKSKKKSKTTVLKTIRIPKEIDDLLNKDATSKRISVNSLVSTILIKYAEWDRYIERFGGITIKPQVLKKLLDKVEDEQIQAIAKESGSRFPKEFVLFLFRKLDLDTYLETLSLICKYKGYAHYELNVEESEYTITLIHDLGYKWSYFLHYIVQEGMISTIGIRPKVDINQGTLIIRFNL